MITRCLALLALVACSSPSSPEAPGGELPSATDPAPAPPPPALTALPQRECEPESTAGSAVELALVANACSNQGQLEQGRALARRALALDVADPTANYVMARIQLSIRQLDGAGCERDAYLDTILDNALKASADPSLRAALTHQPIFAEVRPALRYRVATGVDLSTATATQLAGLRFYSPGNGAYGSRHQLLLGPDGVATLRELIVDDQPHWVDTASTWSVSEGVLHVGGEQHLPLLPTGRLDAGDGGLPEWLDTPAECDA